MAARGLASVTQVIRPMDGAMPSPVLIILVAVVILIAVVVYGGMRYLRSEDEGDFDDLAAEHDRGHIRGGNVSAAASRGRSEHDDFDAERDRPRQPGRTAVNRDRAHRESRQHQRAARREYVDRDDDRTELVPAGGRATRSQRAGGSGTGGPDTFPGRSRTQGRDPVRDGRDLDRAGRRDGRGRGPAAQFDEWDSGDRDDGDFRNGDDRARRDGRASRYGSAVRELPVPDRDALPGRGTAKAAGRPDRRASDSGARDQQEDLLPKVKPRPGKSTGKTRSKRDADGDWPSNEWDELSDVDYWTELAADKPFSADAAPASRPGRSDRGSRRDTAAKRADEPLLPPAGRPADHAARDRGDDRIIDSGHDDVAPRRPSRASTSRTGRMDGYGSAPRRSDPVRSDPVRSEPKPRTAASFDEDPLTSPSFPRIAADDSRSYRRSRSGTHERPAVATPPEYAAAPTNHDQPTGSYDRPGAPGYRDSRARNGNAVPDSYLTPALSGTSYPDRDYPADPADWHPAPAGYSSPDSAAIARGTDTGGYGYSPAAPSAYRTPAADPGNFSSPGGYDAPRPDHHAAAQAGYDMADFGAVGHGSPAAGHEPGAAGYGTGAASYGINTTAQVGYDQLASGYGTGQEAYDQFRSAQATGSAPAGYADYGGQVNPGGTIAPGYADAGSPGGYNGPYQAGYGNHAESPYPYQPDLPASYTLPAAPTAPYYYESHSSQPGHQGAQGGYAGTDPYAVDPYGYSGYGNGSH